MSDIAELYQKKIIAILAVDCGERLMGNGFDTGIYSSCDSAIREEQTNAIPLIESDQS